MADVIAAQLDDCCAVAKQSSFADLIADLWPKCSGLICIMAAGIVVRSIAPLLSGKNSDPCVIVLDEKGRHVISLLSGHLGGGNELAREVAAITGGTAVITTASDVLGHTALDIWARDYPVFLPDPSKLTAASARMVNHGLLKVFSNISCSSLPPDFVSVTSLEDADIVIGHGWQEERGGHRLPCVAVNLFVGIGCNRGTPADDIERSFQELCHHHDLHPQAIAGLASIDIKHDEKGLLDFARRHQLAVQFFNREQINSIISVSTSPAVMKAVGVPGVAEPTSLLAAGRADSDAHLLIAKMKWKDVTLAVAERKISLWD